MLVVAATLLLYLRRRRSRSKSIQAEKTAGPQERQFELDASQEQPKAPYELHNESTTRPVAELHGNATYRDGNYRAELSS